MGKKIGNKENLTLTVTVQTVEGTNGTFRFRDHRVHDLNVSRSDATGLLNEFELLIQGYEAPEARVKSTKKPKKRKAKVLAFDDDDEDDEDSF